MTDDGAHLHPEVVVHADEAIGDAMRAVLGAGDVGIGEGITGTVAVDRRPVLLNDLDPDNGQTTFTFTRKGLDWRLSHVGLPPTNDGTTVAPPATTPAAPRKP